MCQDRERASEGTGKEGCVQGKEMCQPAQQGTGGKGRKGAERSTCHSKHASPHARDAQDHDDSRREQDATCEVRRKGLLPRTALARIPNPHLVFRGKTGLRS